MPAIDPAAVQLTSAISVDLTALHDSFLRTAGADQDEVPTAAGGAK